jgi:type IV secretion system protein VirD4
MTQRSRRRDPWPWTWELPVGIVLVVLVLAMFSVHLGRAIANVLAGGGWQFPARVDFFNSVPGVLRGDAGAGLTDLGGHLASPSSLLVCIGATELILLTLTMVGVKLGLDRWGPGRMRGMATPGESEKLLGLTRLRRHRALIRPDLYGKDRHQKIKMIFNPSDVGWRVGRAHEPRGGGSMWVPWDRTAGVIGPQGSGKTLDLLTPALLAAPGAALVTLTKVDDLLLSFTARSREGGRAWCSTRSAWLLGCRSWCGIRLQVVWIR